MSFSEDPPRGTIARYVPQNLDMQNAAAASFRFGEDESLKGIWKVIRKQKRLIGLGGLCGVLLAVLVCVLMGRQYAATTTIQVGKTDASQTSLLRNETPASASADDLKTDIATHSAILQSDSVILAVVKDLDLQKEPPFAFRPTLWGALTGANAHIQDEKGLPLEQAPFTRDRILKIFEKKLKVQNIPDTRMITITYLSPYPKRAADIANAFVREYVIFQSRSQSTADAQRWLSDQLSQLKDNVETSQNRLADFQQKSGINSMVLGTIGQGGGGGTTHVPVLDRLDTLNQELIAAESNRLAKETIYHLTQTQNPEVVSGLANSTPGNPGSEIAVKGAGLELLQSLRQQQSALRLSYAEMATKYGAKNQRILETQNQLASLDKQISEELKKINARAHAEYLLARRNEVGIRKAFQVQEQEAGRLNGSAVKLQVLTQEAAASRQLYDALYGKLKEVNIQAGLRATNIGVADPALPPSSPTRPNPPLYLAIGLVAGLFAGLSSAFVREHLDDTLTTGVQLYSSGRLPMLGSIPSSPALLRLPSSGVVDGRVSPETSPLIADPRSPGAESYRALRTAITGAADSRRLRSMLVTSPLFGEGKTTVAYNTAVAFALVGKNVLLVDADMRRPRLHHLFSVRSKPGLSDLLAGTAVLDQTIRNHLTVSSLSLLAAGSKTEMPAELLSSKQFDDLLKVLTQKYDLVIVDSPPILVVTDARVLSEKLDATLAVIRAGKTTRTVLTGLSTMLEFSGSRAVGLVLNAVDTKSIDYYDAYGHDGGGEHSNA
jgi:polysaccharide biosynthesis transport protein